MYGALWRAFPGGRGAKALQCVVLFLAVVAVLFVWVFPAVSSHLPFENVTVEGGTPTTSTAQTSSTPSPSGTPCTRCLQHLQHLT